VIYPGSTPVGNATLVVANVLTCNKHSHNETQSTRSECTPNADTTRVVGCAPQTRVHLKHHVTWTAGPLCTFRKPQQAQCKHYVKMLGSTPPTECTECA
jgi:hypothetical protein